MWLGIIVLCTFGAAALISAFFAIRSAIHGQWHMTIGLSLPAIGLGGALLYLVGPAIWLEVAGNPDLNDLPASAEQVERTELEELYAGRIHGGTYYDEGRWLQFEETYDASGNLRGQGGPESDPWLYTWRGRWEIQGDMVCFDYDDTGFDCSAIFRVEDGYVATNHRDEVTSRFVVMAPESAEDDAG